MLLWYKNRKLHQWVLFQVNKIHKMSYPIYQMHSKRKSHIGCCQMCIEMAKTSAKTSKTSGAPPWTPTKPWESENGGFRRVEKKECDCCMPRHLIFVVLSTLPPLFTKLSLCHS